MPPPELAADAPVLDVAHPLEVGAVPVFRHEADAAVLDRADRGCGERRDAHVPLVSEPGLDHGDAAVAARDREAVRLDLLDEARGLEVGDDALPRLEPVEPAIGCGRLVVDSGVGRQDVDERQAAALPHLVVVEVVRRRQLHAAGAERGIRELVREQRDLAAGQRQRERRAVKPAIALVVRVKGDGDVAEHRLGTRGRDGHVTLAVRERIADVPERAVLLLGLHLEVGHRRLQHRIPVDEPLAAVDEPVLVQADECRLHGTRHPGIHGEAVAAPVDRGAEPAHLARDRAAGFLLPAPHARREGIATEFVARLALGHQLPLDDHLRGNARVVRARLPQGAVARHAVETGEGVHDRVLERVAHVERPGHVRRRYDDAEGRPVARRREEASSLPTLVSAFLDVARRVGLVHAPGVARLSRRARAARAGPRRRVPAGPRAAGRSLART